MIKHIIFDMGNVLLRFDAEATARGAVGDHPEISKIVEYTVFTPEWKLLDNGLISEEEALSRMVARAPQYQKEITAMMSRWTQYLFPIEEMVPLIARLKEKGYSLHLLSNASLRFFEYSPSIPAIGMMDTINVSARIKLLKPQHEIYLRTLDEHHLPAAKCLFIDDLAENIAGAEAVGIHGHRFVGAVELERYLGSKSLL